jgi:DNA-binding NtrC family response regulator
MMSTNKSIKLLIVDDDIELRNAVVITLNRQGFEISTAASGTEALHLMALNNFDIIVSDINMPQGDGLWLLKSVKDSGSPVPFILVTGNVSVSEKDVQEKGAFGLLRKPALPPEYYAMIDAALISSQKNSA